MGRDELDRSSILLVLSEECWFDLRRPVRILAFRINHKLDLNIALLIWYVVPDKWAKTTI